MKIVRQLANGVRLGLPLATTRQHISHFLGCHSTKIFHIFTVFLLFFMIIDTFLVLMR